MGTVLIYARASRDPDDRGHAVAAQVKACRRLAIDRWNGEGVTEYSDTDLSGALGPEHRPGYAALLDRLRSKPAPTALVVTEQSRMTRDAAEWERLLVVLELAGLTEIHTVDRGPVTVGEGNRFVGRIMTLVDAEERERVRLRTRRAHAELAASGRPSGGAVYGYQPAVGPDGLPARQVDMDEANEIRRMVDRVMVGASQGEIVADLNARKVPTPRGGRLWRRQTVRSILTSPTIAGLRVHNGQIVGTATWPPIITPDRWRALQDVLGARGTVRQRRPRRRLLTGGIVVCGVCGKGLMAGTQTNRNGTQRAYECTPQHGGCNRISILSDPVDEIVVNAVIEMFSTDAFREALARAEAEQAGSAEVADELAQVEALLDDLGRLLGRGEIDPAAFRSAHDEAAARAADLRQRLHTAAGVPTDLDIGGVTVDEFHNWPLHYRRALIGLVIAQVLVLPGRAGRIAGRPRTARGIDPARVEIVWRG